MKRAAGALVLAGLVLVLALATGFSLFYRLFYVLALAMVGSGLWAWLNLRWLEVRVERRARQVEVGGQLVERMTVRNKGWLPKPWLEVRELTDMPGHEPGMTVSLGGGAFRSWRTVAPCRRRGSYTLGPVRVATGDPLGLFRLEASFCDTQRLVVLPAVVPLPAFVLPAADLPGEGPLRARPHHVTPHAATVREYAPGDSVKKVHWPTTARLTRLMVKEFDPGFTSDVWVLVDMQERVQVQDGSDATDELAVTIAASVSRRLLNLRLSVGLAASGSRFALLPPDRTEGHFGQLLETLAQLRADGNLPIREAIAYLEPRLSRHTTLVVVTPSVDPGWPAALDPLRRRGVRWVAVSIDPASFGGSDSAAPLLRSVAERGVPIYLVRKGEDLRIALATPHLWSGNGPGPLQGRTRGVLERAVA
ncbi:MAG: DUF58 domain-containing protein [Chloroflexi bacterium]|nr:DUF58 domain-containing protein [Chloroflexota bacterium]